MPRYTHTWKVKEVLSFLKSLGLNPLKTLSEKLAMLLALVLAHRSSDLIRLSAGGIKEIPNGLHYYRP